MGDQSINLLLIEDDADDARLIHTMLSGVKNQRFEVAQVDQLSAGLEHLAKNRVDLILLNLWPPDCQSFETFARLHARESHTPILVLARQDDELLASRAMQEGAQDYLVKEQLSQGMLVRAIRYAIERKHEEQIRHFLTAVSNLLVSSLDYEMTLEHIAQLAIPNLADWCAIHILEADGMIRRLALAHIDPARAALAQQRPERYTLDPNARYLVPQVLRTGQPELYSKVHDSHLSASARDSAHLEALRLLGLESYICVPLVNHRRTFGTITLAFSTARRRYNQNDLTLAEELARRAAIAINNAQLYRVAQEEIAERKQAEEQLQYQANLLQHVSDAIIATDLNFCITSWNHAAEELYGWSADEVIGKPVAEVLHTTYSHDQPERVRQQLLAQGTWKGETIHAHRDGTSLTVLASIAHVKDSAGNPTGMVSVNRDITARKRAEELLQRSERTLKLFVEYAPAAIAMLDRNMIYIAASHRYLADYRLHEQNIVGRSHYEVFPEMSEAWKEIHRRCLAGETAKNDEDPFPRADGTLDWVHWEIHPWYDHMGNVGGIILFSEVITERKNLEAQFLQAQKMESVGRLAGGVAHDFNNLLTAISGYAELVQRTIPSDSPAHADLAQIIKAAERAAGLTHQLMAFARKQIIEPRVLNLNDLIGNIGNMLQRLIGEDIDLVTRLSPGLGQVKVDPGQIEQVLVNLAVNARDAMPNGGKLMIETHEVVLGPDYAQQHLGVGPGAYVMLAISDTGSGMDPQTQQRIFEPFFTTKGPEHGTGLGLSTCYGIIKQHGGSIWVYSEPGHGTTFRIYLPLADAPAETQTQMLSLGDLPRGNETVLLAEDDPAVRALAMRVLNDQGYNVLEAVDGATALRLASEYTSTAIDLLITDLVMPHISGKALFEQINQIHPNIKALFMSGYTDDAIVHHGRLDPGVAFLQKPFSSSALVYKVRETLDLA